jgi:hypothetical protein
MNRLNATQTEKLLKEGYTYKDIALFEQTYLDSYPVHPKDEAFNQFMNDRIQGLFDIPGNIIQHAKNTYPNSVVDRVTKGDWSGAGNKLIQNIADAPFDVIKGIKNVGSGIADWFREQVEKGYNPRLVERFVRSYLGNKTLTEQKRRISNIDEAFKGYVNKMYRNNLKEQTYLDAYPVHPDDQEFSDAAEKVFTAPIDFVHGLKVKLDKDIIQD